METNQVTSITLKRSTKLTWHLRRRLWDGVALVKYLGNKPDRIRPPPKTSESLRYVPMKTVFPSIPIETISVADHVPADERSTFKRKFYSVQMWLNAKFGPHQPGLPAVHVDGEHNLRWAYGPIKRKLCKAPELPEPFQGARPDLGLIAIAGPYWGYLVATGKDCWEWDLRELGRFEHWPGLRSLGVRVRFGRDASGRKPEATAIECELGTITPTDPDWDLAVKLALCALTTHVMLVRHFNAIHLAFGAKFSQATRNQLPSEHPLFRLIWPHIHDTQFSNELVTLGQMTPEGDFPMLFSYTHAGMCALFEHTYARLRLDTFDIERDARARGELGTGLDTLSYDNMKQIFDVLLEHTSSYVNAYYESDAALVGDAAVQAWLEEMRRNIPNGISMTEEEVSRASVARLIAIMFHVVIAEHALRDSSPWNYILWTNYAPIRVYADGSREPLDVFQHLVNANMLLQVHRALLTQDFSYLALDTRGRERFSAFRANLLALEARNNDATRLPWKLYPAALNANMNA